MSTTYRTKINCFHILRLFKSRYVETCWYMSLCIKVFCEILISTCLPGRFICDLQLHGPVFTNDQYHQDFCSNDSTNIDNERGSRADVLLLALLNPIRLLHGNGCMVCHAIFIEGQFQCSMVLNKYWTMGLCNCTSWFTLLSRPILNLRSSKSWSVSCLL